MPKKRFCIAGASGRGFYMYADSLNSEEFRDAAELVGVYDSNPGRARLLANAYPGTGVKAYETFYQMMTEAKPDALIVTTVDRFHCEYAVQALEYGAAAVIEKPMCIDAPQVRALLDAKERTGGTVIVTFNMRYMPNKLMIKKLLQEGVIGDIESVAFEWNLIHGGHGTSYYHRWNGHLDLSGGLLLTKSAHHFDLANWYVDSYPAKVSAFGALKRYGKNGAFRGKNCHECGYTDQCPYYTSMINTPLGYDAIPMFVDNAKYDGYTPDGCVFDETIDAYDTANLAVLYENGVTMSYSLTANAPYEGWRIAFTGTKGRLEASEIGTGPENVRAAGQESIRVMPYKKDMEIIRCETQSGSHGGGDIRMIRDIIHGLTDDPFRQRASVLDGSAAVLLGAAANVSIQTGKTIDITELLGIPLESYRE